MPKRVPSCFASEANGRQWIVEQMAKFVVGEHDLDYPIGKSDVPVARAVPAKRTSQSEKYFEGTLSSTKSQRRVI